MPVFLQIFILCFIQNIGFKIFLDSFFVPSSLRAIQKYALFFSFCMTSVLSSHYVHITPLRVILFILLSALFLRPLYITGYISVCMVSLFFFTLASCVEIPCYFILTYLLGQERLDRISTDYLVLTFIGIWVNLLELIVILIFARLFGRRGYLKHLNSRDWLVGFFLPVLSIFAITPLLFANIKNYDLFTPSLILYSFFSSLFLLLFNLIFFNYLQNTGFFHKRRQELQILEERMRSELQGFTEMKSLYEEQRRKTHEFKNQIRFINGLMEKDDFDTLKKYVRKIEDDLETAQEIVKTVNPVLNVLLNQAIKKASVSGISIVPDIAITEPIPITDNDLVIILSNLLNNAVEHCETLQRSNKAITFRLESSDRHFLVVCSNPIETPIRIEDNLVKTTKKNRVEHGFGLKNIIQTVEKYKGDISVTTDNNRFKYVILINRVE